MQIFDTMIMVNNMDLKFDLRSIRKAVTRKNFYVRSLVLVFSVAMIALNYNLFLTPNDFVIGGTSGIAIILKKLFGLEPAIFIGITSIILIIISFILLGSRETARAVVGSILYPVFVYLTKPLALYLSSYIDLDSLLLVALIAGAISGFFNGIIYKIGFNTGGSDILMKIMNKYVKVPEGKAVFSINIIIMIFGAIIFGVNKFIYSFIILYLSTVIIDKIIIGISNSKLFIIHTKEIEKVKDYIIEDLKTGVTILDAKGGFSKEKSPVLMCVVPTRDFYLFKEMVLEIDPDAFFVITDCYGVTGGVKRGNLPFIYE